MAVKTENILGTCGLCERDGIEITAHHLIPKTVHKSKYAKKNFSYFDLMKTAGLCEDCHKTVHATYSEKELLKEYNTIESLRNSEKISKFINFVRNQSPGKRIKIEWSNDRRKRNG